MTLLLASANSKLLFEAIAELQGSLQSTGLMIAPEEVQQMDPFQYLGHELNWGRVRPLKLQFSLSYLKTLNDWQLFLGDIN